jgi:hypothetical protein
MRPVNLELIACLSRMIADDTVFPSVLDEVHEEVLESIEQDVLPTHHIIQANIAPELEVQYLIS